MCSEIKNRDLSLEVLQCSHVGGHKYAGNVIFLPSGHWYGFIEPTHVPKLLDIYQGKATYNLEGHYRGNEVNPPEQK